MELSLGISPCPNDVFIFSGILLDALPASDVSFSVVFEDVEKLNRRAQKGELDVVKMSCANYARCAVEYDLLECGGALGRGCGPLLLSNGAPPEEYSEILVPGEGTTANFLLDFYLRRRVSKTYMTFDALYEHLLNTPGATGVVIHEKRFTFERDGLTLVRDLGSHWEEQTGYAIPLGVIGARAGRGLKPVVQDSIRASLRWAREHFEDAVALCKEHASDLDDQVVRSHIELYVNEFSEDLGAEGRAAVGFFLERQRLCRAGS